MPRKPKRKIKGRSIPNKEGKRDYLLRFDYGGGNHNFLGLFGGYLGTWFQKGGKWSHVKFGSNKTGFKRPKKGGKK